MPGDAIERIRGARANARRERLLVLVWGPTKPGPTAPPELIALYKKRCDIRDFLRRDFPNAEVFFSEDDVWQEATGDLDSLTAERLQARAADCVIVIDETRGAHVEVDVFSSDPLIAAKTHVFVKEEHLGTGLAGEVQKSLEMHGFTSDDLIECNVAKRSVELVEGLAINKYLDGRQGVA